MRFVKLIGSLSLVLAAFFGYGQTPGGVDTPTNIRYWFNSNSFLSTTNGTSVSSWSSIGGNTNSLTQSSNSKRPTVRNNGTDNINGNPVIRFDGSNDILDLANNNDINLGTRSEQTIHIVFRTGNDITTTQFLYEQGGVSRGISMYIHNGSFYTAIWNDENDGAASNWNTDSESFTVATNTTYIASFIYDGGTTANDGNAKLYSSGTLAGTISNIGTLYEHTGSVAIGAVGDNTRTHTSNNYSGPANFNGDIAEFVIATYAQNSNELELTVDALAAKYGLTPATNLYNGDNAGNGNHDYNVFGIRQDATGNANSSANSGGAISSSNPTNLGNNEFLIIGENSGSASSWTSTETHDPLYTRVAKEWYVHESGDVGTVTLTLHGTELPSYGHEVVLLVDADGDFSAGATVHNTTASGSNYTVSLNLNDGDFLTVAAKPAEVSVTATSQTVAENIGSGTITFQLNQTLATDATVNYTAINGTAQNGLDFIMPNGSATILAGNTTATATFSIIYDCITEATETFDITISSSTAGSIGTATQTVSITNQAAILTGPAGTSCGLQLWYKPDAGITTNSGKVQQWVDQQSGITADAAGSNQRPTFNSTATDKTFNFQPYLEFDGSSDVLGLNNSLATNAINAVYGFVVFRTNYSNNAYNDNWAFLDYDRSEYFNFYIHGNGKLAFSGYDANAGAIMDNTAATVVNDNIPHIGAFIYDNSITNDTRVYADGSLDYSADMAATNALIGNSVTRFGLIGDGSEATVQNGDDNNINYKGDIAEILYFNNPLDAKQINMMHSHLGLKYGINLNMADDGTTAGFDERDYHNSSETVIWNYSDNNSYSNAKAGIIRDDDAPLTITKSTSTSSGAVLTIESSSLNNNNSLVWGHNGGTLTSSTNTPSGVSQRFDRVWKVDEVGETGNLTVSIDLTGITSLPSSASEFSLLIDSDSDFSNAAIHTTGASLNSNVITFTNVDLDDVDYFTLGYFKDIIWNGVSWSNGSGPAGAPNTSDAGKNLIIDGNGATLTANAEVNQMQVTTGNDITINSNISLTVANGIANNGTVNVLNAGSIVQENAADLNSGTGTYNVTRNTGTLADDTRYQYWSSPMTSETMGDVFTGSNPIDFYFWNDATQQWATQNAASAMTPGKGYTATGTIGNTNFNENRTFSGTINNGTVTLATSAGNTEDILIGNPYPSAIYAPSFVADNAGINGSLYFWNHSTAESGGNNAASDYATWTGLGTTSGNNAEAPDDYIQTGQGFFVTSSSNNPTITFENDQREAGNNTQFFKSSSSNTKQRAWLSLHSPAGEYNQLLVGITPEATMGFDRLLDGEKFEGNPAISFFSFLDTMHMAIQAISAPNQAEELNIPLGLKTTETGTFSIRVDSVSNWSNSIELVLEDKELAVFTELANGTTYTFQLNASGDVFNRFALRIKETEQSTGVADGITPDLITIYSVQNGFNIESTETLEDISVFDLTGKLVFSSIAKQTEKIKHYPFEQSGIYLVKVQSVTGVVTTKRIHIL